MLGNNCSTINEENEFTDSNEASYNSDSAEILHSKETPAVPISRMNSTGTERRGLIRPQSIDRDGAINESLVSSSSGVNTGLNSFAFLAGRYFRVEGQGLAVKLRNFAQPLLSAANMKIQGNSALAQIKPVQERELVGQNNRLPRAVAHPRRGSEGSLLHNNSPTATIAIGDLHTVALQTRYTPFQMFYDISASLNEVHINFSPWFIYPLKDLSMALTKFIPPLPQLNPIQQIKLTKKSKGQSSSNSSAYHQARRKLFSNNSNSIQPVNYLHLLRGMAHGKMAININNTQLRLIASLSPTETEKYLKLTIGNLKVAQSARLLKCELYETAAIQLPHKLNQANLLEMPAFEIQLAANWLCEEGLKANNRINQTDTNSEKQEKSASNSNNNNTASNHLHIHIPSSHKRAASSFIPHSTASSAQLLPSIHQHQCNLHISASIFFSSSKPHNHPLALCLHSSSLSNLIQFALIYSKLPIVPFPTPIHLSNLAQHFNKLAAEDNNLMANTINPYYIIQEDTVADSNSAKTFSILLSPVGREDASPPANLEQSNNSSPARSTRSMAAAESNHPKQEQEHVFNIHGFYMERVVLDRVQLSIWEGADLGPARGICFTIETIYLAAELNSEENIIHQHSSFNASPAAENCSLLALRDPLLSPSFSFPISASKCWYISNVMLGIERFHCVLVYNQLWREYSQLNDRGGLDNILQSNDRVLVVTYENQRYTLGKSWSAKNLLPTDRAAWTNAEGTIEIRREDCKLPSADWMWENDWQLDFELRKGGEVDEEGNNSNTRSNLPNLHFGVN
jgi:hypothetical protein